MTTDLAARPALVAPTVRTVAALVSFLAAVQLQVRASMTAGAI